MRTLREILTDLQREKGWCGPDETPTEQCLEETLRECYPVVWTGDEDQHRWRVELSCVCKIIDEGIERFFCYSSCMGTNDNSWEDAGYSFEGIDNVYEVYPHNVMTIEYKSEPQQDMGVL